jgi:hypothetical protein
MLAKQIQFFGKNLDLLTEQEQKAIKGGRGRGRGRRRNRNNERNNGGNDGNSEEVDPGCPPDYED